MTLQFLGASQTVTGSRFLLKDQGSTLLIDCGLFQGLKSLRLQNWEPFPVSPKLIDAVFLTHAHLDHSGYLPLLVKNGFSGKIYATKATVELARILLMDSGYLQEEEAKFANRKGFSKHHPALPLYTRKDAEWTMHRFADVEGGTPVKVGPFEAEFIRAGHLLGAASIRIRSGNKSLLFSGDLGRPNDPVVHPPAKPPGCDFLVVESTYGDRKHPEVNPLEELREIITRTCERGGTVVIPSFAVGRAQLMLYFMKELKRRNLIPDVPIFLNSPMASAVNRLFCTLSDEHRLSPDEAREVCDVATIVATSDESKALNEDDSPKIIIAASGMATGGRVLHHLKKFAPSPNNSIVFAGFQAAGTRGEAIVNGAKEIKIHGEFWPIRAEVYNLESLSAHADADEILDWIRQMPSLPKKTFVVHGEAGAASVLADRLRRELNIDAITPELMQIEEI